MTNIEYIKDEDFRKLSKKKKLSMQETYTGIKHIPIDKLVIIHTNKKSSGWSLGAFFAHTPEKGWWRSSNYDCFRINTDIENPIELRYQIIKADFEYGGLQIFGLADENHEAFLAYGGEVIIKKKI